MTTQNKIQANRVASFALDVGTFLLASGAHCGRVKSNLTRMASTWGFDIDLNPTFTGLAVTVKEAANPSNSVTLFRTAPPHRVHLSMLTDISHLSWKVHDDKLTMDEAEQEFVQIKAKPAYNSLVVAVAVGLACAGLCFFSLGDIYNALITFAGAFVGSLIRVFLVGRNFNPMICIAFAAFVTTLITGLGSINNIGVNPEAAMATAVLYLIPGVPLINCVIDLIEGYLSSSINRALFAGFILLCIAAGMTLCITLLGISNFY